MTPYLCFRSKAENQSFTSGYLPNSIVKYLYTTLLLLLLFVIPAKGWGQIFVQDFSASGTLSSYISTTPNNGQFNGISTSGSGTVVSINNGGGNNKLRFARTGNAGTFTRSSNFSPTPTSMIFKFDLTVSGNTTAQTTAGQLQIGTGFTATTNSAEAGVIVHSRLGINLTATNGVFTLRDIGKGANSTNLSGTQTITWVVNNSGSDLSYSAPDGTMENIGNDKFDVWVGTTRIFDEAASLTPAIDLNNFKFIFTQGNGTIDFDNFNITTIPNCSVPANPTGTISCTTPACSSTTLTYTNGSGQPESGVDYYWQTSATGTSTLNNAANPLNVSTSGTYYVRAYNGSCWSTASTAGYAVTVNMQPSISAQPDTTSLSTCIGTNFSTSALSVTASNASGYQWYSNTTQNNIGGTMISGATNASYTVPTTLAGTLYYYVEVKGNEGCPSVFSNPSGARTVNTLPANPTGTISGTTPACSSTTLTYTNGSGQPESGVDYYWQTSATGTSTVNNADSPLNVSTSGTYYVRAYNGSCWSTASTAGYAVTVNESPSIIAHPANQSVTKGTLATFTVTSTGASGFQWYQSTDNGASWTTITGASAGSYTTPATTLSMNGYRYRVMAVNDCGEVTSSAAVLTVTDVPCGFENFDKSNLTAAYSNGSFVGNNNITWTYVAARDENNDANISGIQGKAIMLRRLSDNSSIKSSTISTGIGNFSVKLYKGFTGGEGRQVELFINGISKGVSMVFDDYNEHLFEVYDINIEGDITIEIKNKTGNQVIIDDITWSCYDPSADCTPSDISVSPLSGPAGTVINISGSNFSSSTTVNFGDKAAVVTYKSPTILQAVVPAGVTTSTVTVNTDLECDSEATFTVITENLEGCEGVVDIPGVPVGSGGLVFYEVFDRAVNNSGLIVLLNASHNNIDLNNFQISRSSDGTGGDEVADWHVFTPKFLRPGSVYVLGTGNTALCDNYPVMDASTGFTTGLNRDDRLRILKKADLSIVDEVRAPDYDGYYLKRKSGSGLLPNLIHDGSDWTTEPMTDTYCQSGMGISPIIASEPISPAVTGINTAVDCTSTTVFADAIPGDSAHVLSYQWYVLAPGETAWSPVSDNTVYSGSASPTLIITDTAGLDHYQYYVQVRENGVTCYKASDAVMIRDSETEWNGGGWSRGVPQPWSKVVIEADYNTKTHGSLTVCELTVNSGNFVIEKNYPVTVQKSVLNNAGDETHFIIENDGQLLQVDDVQNTGKIMVKRTMQFTDDRKEYNYLSSPVEGQHMKKLFGGVTTNTPFVLVLKESTNFFVNAAESDYQDKGKGFAVKEAVKTYTGSEARFIGKPLNGSFTVHVSRSSASLGWNLIGNPYASNLDLKLLYEQNESKMIPEFRFWDNRSNNTYVQYGGAYNGYSYAFYNALSGEGNPAPGGDTGNNTGTPGSSTPEDGLYRFAKVGQGFIIRAKEEADIAFSNTQRSLNQPDRGFFGKTQNQKDRYRLQMITPSNLYLTNTVVYFERGNSKYGPEDSRHPSSAATEAFYTLAGADRTIINGRPLFMDTDVVTLGHKHQVGGTYKIRAIDRIGVFAGGQRIYLKDKLLNIVTDLTEGDYSFRTEAGEFTNRFEIVYQPTVFLGSGETALSATVIYRDGEDFVVRSRDRAVEQVEIYDASGRLLLTLSGNTKELRFSASTMSDGMYVVKSLLKGGAVYTQKIRK